MKNVALDLPQADSESEPNNGSNRINKSLSRKLFFASAGLRV